MRLARVMADLVVILHFAYVAFVVIGLFAILAGIAMRAQWVRNPWFRFIHLAMIGIVVVQAWLGVTCPLTTLENHVRLGGGQEPYPLDFIEFWTHRFLVFRFGRWVFGVADTAFGVAVGATFILAPTRGKAGLRGNPR